jgi:hypothetical protein
MVTNGYRGLPTPVKTYVGLTKQFENTACLWQDLQLLTTEIKKLKTYDVWYNPTFTPYYNILYIRIKIYLERELMQHTQEVDVSCTLI